jgi:hypothetical protein
MASFAVELLTPVPDYSMIAASSFSVRFVFFYETSKILPFTKFKILLKLFFLIFIF